MKKALNQTEISAASVLNSGRHKSVDEAFYTKTKTIRITWLKTNAVITIRTKSVAVILVNRGDIVRPWSHGAGSECSVLIYYSHNSHSLFSYSVDLVLVLTMGICV